MITNNWADKTIFYTRLKNLVVLYFMIELLSCYLRNMKNEKVKTKKSKSGFGLFANHDFKKGELIIEYTGEKITEAEANRRGGKYLFELNDEWTIDGKGRDNLARYINHACKPNCYPELDKKEEHIYIYAKRNIKAEEELTYDYGKVYFDDLIGKDNCRCSSCEKQRDE